MIEQYCTFPAVEKIKLFKLTLVNFLIGNEDMHVKNFSLMTWQGKVLLTPAYDILNTSIVMSDPREEIALPVKGKKRQLDAGILIDYFGRVRLGLNQKIISSVLNELVKAIPVWERLIGVSFLSEMMKTQYRQLLKVRSERLFVCIRDLDA